MTFTGVGEVAGGFVLGKIGDHVGRTTGIVVGAVLYTTALVLTQVIRLGPSWAMHNWMEAGAPWVAYVAATCYGMADSAFNTQTYAMMSTLLPDAHSFTLFQLIQNGGSAIGFYALAALPLQGVDGSATQLWLQGAMLVVAVAGAVATDKKWLGQATPPPASGATRAAPSSKIVVAPPEHMHAALV